MARQTDEKLFRTHMAGDWCAVGTVHDGKVVTRVEPLLPTRLLDGGVQPCWQVYGRDQGTENREGA